jgi:phospholipid/cholesterol/gamma-HCH transport system substrate-binding protein
MTTSHPLLKFLGFTAVCIGFSVWLVMMIGNISFESRHTYSAEFADAQGLLVNDMVKISGVNVGKVTGIEVQPGGLAKVTFEVRDDVALPRDSRVVVRWRDVFGLRFLYVQPGTGPAVDPEHSFPPDQTAGPSDLGLLLQRMVPVIRALDPEVQNQVLEALSEALVGRTDEVQDLISQGASLTQAVASREDELGRLLDSSAQIMDAYADRDEQLKGLLDSFTDVSETIAGRNDTLERSIVALADVQQELRRLVEANDANLKGALDEAEQITEVLSVNHDNLEDIMERSSRGLVSYHLISRIGQFFNIRAVGFSLDGEYVEGVMTERGARLWSEEGSSNASMRSFFGAPAGGGR